MCERALLEVTGLEKRYGAKPLFRGLSLAVAEGEVVVLFGRNGSGKTTLVDILGGEVEADAGRIRVRSSGQWHDVTESHGWMSCVRRWERPLSMSRLGVRRIWQDCRLFPSLTLLENMAVACPQPVGESPWGLTLRPLRALREERLAREYALRQLRELGFEQRRDAFGAGVSLGQEKRVAIRRTAETAGRLLLLDEPLAGLDASGRAQVIETIKAFVADGTRSVLVTEHLASVERLRGIGGRMLRLSAGGLTALDQSCSSTQTEGDSALVQYVGHGALASLQVDRSELPDGASLVRLRPSGPFERRILLSVESLVVERGGRPVVGFDSSGEPGEGLSFDLAFGEVGVLLAPNGWGKSTLLEVIAGLLPSRMGLVRLGGAPINQLAPWARNRLGLRLLRARDFLFDSLTAEETFRLLSVSRVGSIAQGLPPGPMRVFSGGERRRLGLGTLKRPEASVTLVDEPFSGLDSSGVEQAWPLLGPRPNSLTILAIPEGSQGGRR